jgi:trehalose-6-phosphate synthase
VRGDERSRTLRASEFAGAAAEIANALCVNPYDVHGTTDTVHRALTMDAGERRRRMCSLRVRVSAWDADTWAGAFLGLLSADPRS